MNVGNPRHKNTVSGLVLCRHDKGMLAKSVDIWLSGQHVANMLMTFPAKSSISYETGCVSFYLVAVTDKALGTVLEGRANGPYYCLLS